MKNILMLKDRNRFSQPQKHFADACGLSFVHTNRTIQELRHRRLLYWKRHTVPLLRRKELESVAEFTPDYLHLSDCKD
jgi:hypothetical protein